MRALAGALTVGLAWACQDQAPTAVPPTGALHRYTTTSAYGLGQPVEFRSRVGTSTATRCMDVQAASRDPGARIGLWSCLDATQQTFRWDAASSTIRVYEDQGTPLCVDVGPAPQRNSPVATAACTGGPSQQWEPLTSVPNGDYHIRLRQYPSLCLDVPGGLAQEGVALQVYPCITPPSGFTPSQQWDALIVSSRGPGPGFSAVYGTGRHFELRSAVADNRCLDVAGASRDVGAPLTIYECLTATQQTFSWDPASGLVRVYVDSGNALCVDAGATPQQGGAVYTYTCHGGPQQQWEPAGDGRGLRLRAYPAQNLCLDVPGGTAQLGTQLWLRGCYGGTPQQWTAVQVLYARPMDPIQPVPNSGAAVGGSGQARFSLRPDAGEVCARAAVQYDRDTYELITMAHIHPAPAQQGSTLEIASWVDGDPLVVGLNAPSNGANHAGVGTGRQCLPIARASIVRVLDDPGDFYFNVHTPRNTVPVGGILRGQLSAHP